MQDSLQIVNQEMLSSSNDDVNTSVSISENDNNTSNKTEIVPVKDTVKIETIKNETVSKPVSINNENIQKPAKKDTVKIKSETKAKVVDQTANIVSESIHKDTLSDFLKLNSDSIVSESEDTVEIKAVTESLVEESNVPKNNGIDSSLKSETLASDWWFTPIVLLLTFVHLSVLRNRYSDIMSEIKYFFIPTSTNKIGIQWIQNSWHKSLLTIFGFVNIGAFLFLALYEGRNFNRPLVLGGCILAVLGFYIVKSFLLKVTEYAFDIEQVEPYGPVELMTSVRVSGLLLFPICLCMIYGGELWYEIVRITGLALISVVLLIYISKLVVKFFDGIISVFYLILYLCTLELIPLVGMYVVLASLVAIGH